MRLLLVAFLLGGTVLTAQSPPLHLPPLDKFLPRRAETIYRAVAPRVETDAAMDLVTRMAPLWRLAGNPQFDQSLEWIAEQLSAAGIATHYETLESAGRGWEMRNAEVRLDGPDGEVVLSRAQDRVPLAINSFPTPAEGAAFRLVDVGPGTGAADYQGKEVAGAVVLADGPLGGVWNQAVKARGAAGVISTQIAGYTRSDTTPEVLQWGSIPFDSERTSFGFKATPRAARRLRERLTAGAVQLHVGVDSVFHGRPVRSLVAEIPGARWPAERVVLVAHVQEPGANDNASGCGTLLAAALAMHRAIAEGALPAPARTITMIWGDEIRASNAWIVSNALRSLGVLAMMSLDMTGEDTAKTGGTFLIEKGPDPSAIWERPSDPHSEWGAGDVDRALVKGSFLNDLHLGVALRRARDTGWVVRTNPYEGGSDHTSFTRSGVPALLNWHFTDRYYHTNLDTIDKVSAVTIGHVAIAVGTTAMFLGSADKSDVKPTVRLLERARNARMATERRNRASSEIRDAWKQWYEEAILSARRLASSDR